MSRVLAAAIVPILLVIPTPAAPPQQPWEKAVADAAAKKPMTADEAKAFALKLAKYVEAHHLKTDPNSPQRAMVYEYFDTTRAGRFDQWVQGEALDTMHDGAWLAMAMANAYRATGERFYRDFLVKWQLPFYTKMLNDSDTLFDTKQLDIAEKGVRFDREHALQPGEKGFCPYWWDDGASVSLERRRVKDPFAGPPFACTDRLAGQPNPQARLSGYSHGSSNHLAQDLGPMLMLGWLTLRESDDPAERKLAADCAQAAKHLQECRTRHGFNSIPAVVGPAGLTNNDPGLLKRLGGEPKLVAPANHYTKLLGSVGNKDQRHATPAFADDMEYTYYAQLARTGGKLPPPVLFKLIYDCYTEPMLFRYWSDTGPVPPGLNRFDLAGGPYGKGGKFESYRSDRPIGFGSRFGPQNMTVCGLALQALDANPGLWDKAVDQLCGKDVRVGFLDDPTGGVAPVSPRPERLRPVSTELPQDNLSRPVELGGATIRLASRRDGLHLTGAFPAGRLTIEIAAAPGGKGPRAVVTARDGACTVADADGGRLRADGSALKTDAGPTVFGVTIPYTVVKGQGVWMNGIELGRYTISVGKESQTFVLASAEKQVRAALERELSRGLRTWEAIFESKGYIPTGLGAGGDWDKFSDSGGYAHLISAASQYVLWKEGRRDWEAHRLPAVK